jgi:hypothetical protein
VEKVVVIEVHIVIIDDVDHIVDVIGVSWLVQEMRWR